MHITVVGMGYVDLSNAALLARRHAVTLLDIAPEKVAALNGRKSPIYDAEIEKALEDDLKETIGCFRTKRGK